LRQLSGGLSRGGWGGVGVVRTKREFSSAIGYNVKNHANCGKGGINISCHPFGVGVACRGMRCPEDGQTSGHVEGKRRTPSGSTISFAGRTSEGGRRRTAPCRASKMRMGEAGNCFLPKGVGKKFRKCRRDESGISEEGEGLQRVFNGSGGYLGKKTSCYEKGAWEKNT